MPLDGIAVSNIVSELKTSILYGKVDKIYQPMRDEILMQVRNHNTNYKLLVTAQAAHPRIHLTTAAKQNPDTAPMFCMLLRKFLCGGRVTAIAQPLFERIIILTVLSQNEMGDITPKELIIEMMGKHSNIILVKNDYIIDSIKRVPADKSSVRQVLPGLKYVLPPSRGKVNPINVTDKEFNALFDNTDKPPEKLILSSFNGISPIAANEIVLRSGVLTLSVSAKTRLYAEFLKIMAQIVTERFNPVVYYNEEGGAVDFSSIRLKVYEGYDIKEYNSISALLDDFYLSKDKARVKAQKSADLKKLVTNNIERCVRKREQQLQTLKNTENRDELKLYGELITSNIHNLALGMTTAYLPNFYDEGAPETEIPLDPLLTPAENAQAYFKKYNKEKRAFAALTEQIKQTEDEKLYLDQLLQTIETSEDEADLNDVRQELFDEGYIKKSPDKKAKKAASKSKPLSFKSSDGFIIYVGKNNKQNEDLTLKTASNTDIWLHTKVIPGAHVIIKTNGRPVPDKTLNEAAELACYYSKGKGAALVAVDYTLKKHVKKPAGAKTGMVIYEHYKTAYVTAEEGNLPPPL